MVSCIVFLFAAELLFRWMIFSHAPVFKNLKKPGNYSFEISDDYWKLLYRFDTTWKPPQHPHPLLGWIGFFDWKTLQHRDANRKKEEQRPVLLYGDSFAQCQNDSIQCFEDILNRDSTFSKNNFLFNYGVGGYGVDQAHLLFTKTVAAFEKPFVIFSIMPTDMDRCMLSVRTGQKPYFIETESGLELKGVPIDSIPENFYNQHPPEITSYLYSRIYHSRLHPSSANLILKPKYRPKMLSLNKKLILKTAEELDKRKLDYVFIIFDELYSPEGIWRVDSLKQFFIDKHLYFINAGQLADEDSNRLGGFEFERYILQNDGHPTSYYNSLVCNEIKKYILDYSNYKEVAHEKAVNTRYKKSEVRIRYFKKKLAAAPELLPEITKKARKKGVTVDSILNEEARYMYEH